MASTRDNGAEWEKIDMAFQYDGSNMEQRIATIRACSARVRSALESVNEKRFKPRDFEQQVKNEIKAIRATLTPRQNEDRSDASFRQDAERNVRQRYTRTFIDAYRQSKALIEEQAMLADRLHAEIRKPRLAPIDTAVPKNVLDISALSTRPVLLSIDRQLKLMNTRAHVERLSVDERIALLREADPADVELVWTLDDAIERDVRTLQSEQERDRLVAEAAARSRNLSTEEVIKADVEARHYWKVRAESVNAALEETRAARVSPEERTAFEDWNTTAATVHREISSMGSYALVVQQAGDLAEGRPAATAA